MTENKNIRLAKESDSASLLAIYAPYIRDTAITFEIGIPTVQAFGQRIAKILKKYPWLVCEVDDHPVGYAYASQFNERAAYDWSVDFSIYIDPRYHRQKIATTLYKTLSDLLRLQGFYNAYAGITMPNMKSEDFHRSFGFQPVGVYRHVGYKFGMWHDVKWFEYAIAQQTAAPLIPKTLDAVKKTGEFKSIIEQSL